MVIPEGSDFPLHQETTDLVSVLTIVKPGSARQVSAQIPYVADPVAVENLEVDSPVDPRTIRATVEKELGTTLIVLAVICLLAAVLGLGNSMLMSVTQRQAEFGLRRAQGARPRHLSLLVLSESCLIGLYGGIIGTFLGILTVLGATIYNEWSPVLDLRIIPLAIIFGITVGALSGLYAARRATQVDPAIALRH